MRILALITLLALLAVSLWYAVGSWTALDAPDMPTELYVAMVLGVLFSILVGAGLMTLMFYSSRHGYDERASGHDHHHGR
jgi:hypothetical protein